MSSELRKALKKVLGVSGTLAGEAEPHVLQDRGTQEAPFKAILKGMFDDLDFRPAPEDLDLFVRCRDSPSFPGTSMRRTRKSSWRFYKSGVTVGEIRACNSPSRRSVAQYFFMKNFVDRIILTLLGYGGPSRDHRLDSRSREWLVTHRSFSNSRFMDPPMATRSRGSPGGAGRRLRPPGRHEPPVGPTRARSSPSRSRSGGCSVGGDDLAAKVEWVAETCGDGLGFDVLSFDEADDSERFIEVKTTGLGQALPVLRDGERGPLLGGLPRAVPALPGLRLRPETKALRPEGGFVAGVSPGGGAVSGFGRPRLNGDASPSEVLQAATGRAGR